MLENLIARNETPALFPGLVSGTVKENWDKDHQGMVKAEYFLGEKGKMLSQWIPVMSAYAVSGGGAYFLPEVGCEVLIGFLQGRPDCPVVLGVLRGAKDKLPEKTANEKNTVKLLKTKGGHEIRLEEEEKKEKITVQTPAGLAVCLDDEKKTITLKDKDGKNTAVLDSGKGTVTLDAEKKLILSVGKTAVLTLEANKLTAKSGSISIEANQSLKLKGQSVGAQGTSMELKATGSLKASASGIMELKGSMLKLN